MSDDIEIAGIKVAKADWASTPASIQALVLVLHERLTQLEEKLNQNSQNSSKPPSSDGFGPGEKRKGKPQQRQVSETQSPRQVRKLTPSESCAVVEDVLPVVCCQCGMALSGHDPHPHRHQVMELPPIVPTVNEYRLHTLSCQQCGQSTQASLPMGVSPSGYGERLTAVVALLSGPYRVSHRQMLSLMSDLFHVGLSRGCVGRLRQEMSVALSEAVCAAQAYVQSQPGLHSDETSFPQGSQGWLWVLVTPLVSFFEVVLSRSQATAKALMGETFAGIIHSDRYSAYHWIELAQWQVCWAHLKRDLSAIAQRRGVSQTIGESLLRRQRRLFRWWYQVRDGTLSRPQFIQRVQHLRAGFKAELAAASALPIEQQEKTPFAKTVRTCRRLLKIEPALWTFVYHAGVEPTNNAAERALRPAVIWRRTSFGAQSRAGTQFVARMLTVSASLKAQNRNILDFLTHSIHAARSGLTAPSLLPPPSAEEKLLLPTQEAV